MATSRLPDSNFHNYQIEVTVYTDLTLTEVISRSSTKPITISLLTKPYMRLKSN